MIPDKPAAVVDGEPDERTGLRRLYVALTRAMSGLTVVHAAPLPEQLGEPGPAGAGAAVGAGGVRVTAVRGLHCVHLPQDSVRGVATKTEHADCCPKLRRTPTQAVHRAAGCPRDGPHGA